MIWSPFPRSFETYMVKVWLTPFRSHRVRSPTKLKKQSVNYKKDIQKVNAKRKILLKWTKCQFRSFSVEISGGNGWTRWLQIDNL